MNIEKLLLSTLSKKKFSKARLNLTIRYIATLTVLFIVSFFLLYFIYKKADLIMPTVIFHSSILALTLLMLVDIFWLEKFIFQSPVDIKKAKGLFLKISSTFITSEKLLSESIEKASCSKFAYLAILRDENTGEPSVKLTLHDKDNAGLVYLSGHVLFLFTKERSDDFEKIVF